MLLLLLSAATVLAAVVQRITGLAFVLVLIGPAVLVHGPVEGVTAAVLLAVIASLAALVSAWRLVDIGRAWRLLLAGLLAAPFGALLTRMLPETALLFLIAGLGLLALLAPLLRGAMAAGLQGTKGAWFAGAAAGFLHAASGLSGPALAAYAASDRWQQRSFAASAQFVLVGYGVFAVALRGLPALPAIDLAVLAACTIGGTVAGALLERIVRPALARTVMLWCAWGGVAVVLVRAVLALGG